MTCTDRALLLLRGRADLARLAAFPFDFDLDRAEPGEAVRLASGAALEAVAGDDTGGTYFVCADGSVLYASSEGEAGLIAGSVDEALEVLIGLPGWRDYTGLDPHADDSMLAAAVARTEEATPLWHTVLAPGRADLAVLRANGSCWSEVAADPARRATVLRAAQYDRQQADLPLLRVLLQHEARHGATEELRLAAVLVGCHGRPDDHELLKALREANPDIHHLLGGFPATPQELSRWAADFDVSNYGQDPADEHELTWVELARRQGRTELARCTLLRLLDDCGPHDAVLLGGIAGELTRLGDFTQAARARHLYASLQDDPLRRGSALADLASLQRRAGDIEAAWRSLQLAVSVLNGPPPQPATDQLALGLDLPEPEPTALRWHELGLGLRITEEHFHLARAAAEAGLSCTARASRTAGTALIPKLP
ncbi:hypothetical protein ACIG5E_38345 [Kitasatospora sp. NPDC053057]|uniref:hypothetical protein n=1 Tax=Kitasatospora sp. NPDC053057 TaxID=3364062 RepID=UPI0037CC4EF5